MSQILPLASDFSTVHLSKACPNGIMRLSVLRDRLRADSPYPSTMTWQPTSAWKMPDLSTLPDKQMLNVALDALFGGARKPRHPTSAPELGLWMNFVRLTDKAVREYEAARSEAGTYVNRPNNNTMSPMFRAIDHLENCIDATHRAILNQGRLRTAGFGRGAPQATGRQATLIRLVRNTVEHMDERLANSKLKAGQPVALVPSDTGVTVGALFLPYRDLASCIAKLHRTTVHLRRGR
jgi:hypothetical protein